MPLPQQVPTKKLPANAIWGQAPYEADVSFQKGGTLAPKDIYLDPAMDTGPLPEVGPPMDGLRAAVAARAFKPGDPLGPTEVRIPGVGSMPHPPQPPGMAGGELGKPNIFSAPDPGDPSLIEGESEPAGPAPVPGLSWRWGSKGAPSASQLAEQRASFLATGQSPEIGLMADALRGQQLADENLRNRPDLLEARNALAALKAREALTPEGKASERARLIEEQDRDLASKGLWRARTAATIGMEEPKAEARAFVDPDVAHARFIKGMEAIWRAQTPEAQAQARLEQEWKEALAGIAGYSRAAMYGGDPGIWPGMSAGNEVGGGYAAAKGEAPGENPPAPSMPTEVPVALVEKFAREQNPPMFFAQAKALFERQGIKVIMPRQ